MKSVVELSKPAVGGRPTLGLGGVQEPARSTNRELAKSNPEDKVLSLPVSLMPV